MWCLVEVHGSVAGGMVSGWPALWFGLLRISCLWLGGAIELLNRVGHSVIDKLSYSP
jgi:hypothetical protein